MFALRCSFSLYLAFGYLATGLFKHIDMVERDELSVRTLRQCVLLHVMCRIRMRVQGVHIAEIEERPFIGLGLRNDEHVMRKPKNGGARLASHGPSCLYPRNIRNRMRWKLPVGRTQRSFRCCVRLWHPTHAFSSSLIKHALPLLFVRTAKHTAMELCIDRKEAFYRCSSNEMR